MIVRWNPRVRLNKLTTIRSRFRQLFRKQRMLDKCCKTARSPYACMFQQLKFKRTRARNSEDVWCEGSQRDRCLFQLSFVSRNADKCQFFRRFPRVSVRDKRFLRGKITGYRKYVSRLFIEKQLPGIDLSRRRLVRGNAREFRQALSCQGLLPSERCYWWLF